MPVKVSVVVPVWNPGPYIEPCITSLLGQSLPADEVEIIFVDDGSTDATPARLDDLAAEHPMVRVIHIPNSGWPGRPRNVGIAAALGEYIQFVDQDDRLAPEALERLYAMGVRNGSDIVIGKVASDFRGVPTSIFQRDREACTIFDAPLIDSLTPHKLFRRAFLVQHALTFPEGRRRLEDQLFMVKAYFRAEVVSVLGSMTCYFYMRRGDGAHAGASPIDPAGYYENLREVLDVVHAETSPGPFRDRLLRRFYQTEMLRRLSDKWYLSQEPAVQEGLFQSIRALAIGRMNAGVEAEMPALARLQATILRHGDAPAMIELAGAMAAISASVRLGSIDWVRGDLKLSFSSELGGGALDLVRRSERLYFRPDLTDGLGVDPIDATSDVDAARATVWVRGRDTAVDWRVPSRSTVRLEPIDDGSEREPGVRPVVYTDATIKPLSSAGGRPLGSGIWDLRVRLVVLGQERRVSPPAPDPAGLDHLILPALLGDPAKLVEPRHGEGGLALEIVDVDDLRSLLVDRHTEARPGTGWTVNVALAVASDPRTKRIAARLLMERDGATLSWPAWVRDKDGRLTVTARFGFFRRRLAAGIYRVSVTWDGDAPPLPIGTFFASRDGRVYVERARRVGLLESGVGLLKSGATSVRRTAISAARHLPTSLKSRLRRAASAVR